MFITILMVISTSLGAIVYSVLIKKYLPYYVTISKNRLIDVYPHNLVILCISFDAFKSILLNQQPSPNCQRGSMAQKRSRGKKLGTLVVKWKKPDFKFL